MESNRKNNVVERNGPSLAHSSSPGLCSMSHLEVTRSLAGIAQKKGGTPEEVARSHLGSSVSVPAPLSPSQTLTTVAVLPSTICLPHSQHHTALWWHSRTYSGPGGPHTLSTTSCCLVTDPETTSLGLGSVMWKDYANR